MKALIWIGCCLVYGIIITLFRTSGIILGGIPTFALAFVTFWLARKLCKKYDDTKKVQIKIIHKKMMNNKAKPLQLQWLI